MNTSECPGTWRYVTAVEDGADGITVNRCNGCGDWLVVVGYTGIDVAAADAPTADAAARLAVARKMGR